MGSIFFISDTHFGHSNILNFKDDDGNPVRSFETVEEMDETIVKNWNNTVCPGDTIYHLGDVAIKRSGLKMLERMNGRKILIKGNHDIFRLKDFTPYFKDIRAYRVFPEYGIIASHMPIHTHTLQGRWRVNIHGHLHTNLVKESLELNSKQDMRYINVSVEQINYTPISLDEILDNWNLRK